MALDIKLYNLLYRATYAKIREGLIRYTTTSLAKNIRSNYAGRSNFR